MSFHTLYFSSGQRLLDRVLFCDFFESFPHFVLFGTRPPYQGSGLRKISALLSSFEGWMVLRTSFVRFDVRPASRGDRVYPFRGEWRRIDGECVTSPKPRGLFGRAVLVSARRFRCYTHCLTNDLFFTFFPSASLLQRMCLSERAF